MDGVPSVDAIDADSERSLEMAGDKDAQGNKDEISPFDLDWTTSLAGLNAENLADYLPDDMIEDVCKILDRYEPAVENFQQENREFSSSPENHEYTSSTENPMLCSQDDENANETHGSEFSMCENESSVAGSSTEDCLNSYTDIDNLMDELHDDLSGYADFDELLEELGYKRPATPGPIAQQVVNEGSVDDMLQDSFVANIFDTYTHPGEYLSQIGWHEEIQQNALEQLNDDGFLDWMKHALLNGPY